jgi:hypothetical protein
MVSHLDEAPVKSRRHLSLGVLMLSLASLTVFSLIAIPAFYARPAVTLDNAAILLASDVRYAQNEAAILQVDTCLVFREDGDGYALLTRTGRPLPNPVGGGDLVRKYSRDAIFEGVQLTSIEGLEENRLYFGANGFCLGRADIELHYEEEVRVLHVAKNSGMIEIEGLSRPWSDDGL